MSQRKDYWRLAGAAPVAVAMLLAVIACGSAAAVSTREPVEPTEEVAVQTEEAATAESRGTDEQVAGPYDETADPRADIEAALSLAQADSKYVLLDFGANWCLDCVVLSELFEDPKVKPVLDENYHVVQIDVGYWDRNLDVVEEYGNPIEVGIPAVVVLTPDGEIVGTTKAGELATASTATADDILAYLQEWAPKD